MAKITNEIEDMADILSKQFKRKGIDSEDLKQEGLVEILEGCKDDESKEYYFISMRHRMLKFLQQEKKHGVVMNTHGGDRKSKKFIKSPLKDHLEFVNFCRVQDNHNGKTKIAPNYNQVEYDTLSEVDQETESYLNGRDYIRG